MTDSLPEIARLRGSSRTLLVVTLDDAARAVRDADARARREERERLAEAKQEAPQVWDVQRQEFRSPTEQGEPDDA